MKILIESNFVIPGMQGDELKVVDGVTLKHAISEISRVAEGRLEFFQRGSDELDPEWEVHVNGVPHYDCERHLQTSLSDGDVITVRMGTIGGG